MAEEVLLGCNDKAELLRGIVLPKICTKMLLEEGEVSMKLVNFRGETHIVPFEHTAEGCLKLEGVEWNEFVNSCPYEEVGKLCFIFKGCLTFEVQFFDLLSREFRWTFQPSESIVRSELVGVKEETLQRVKLSELLIYKVNGVVHNNYVWQTTVNIVGRKVNGSAEVVYYSFRERDGICKTAIGFGGSCWTKFCLDNDIHPGHTLKFVDLEGLSFGVDVFTSDGVSIDMLESELNVDEPGVFTGNGADASMFEGELNVEAADVKDACDICGMTK